MPNVPERQNVEDQERIQREAHYYRMFAGALCAVAVTFGLLNLWDII